MDTLRSGFITVLLSILLAVPATTGALVLVALLDDYLPAAINAVANSLHVEWPRLVNELSARWPEVAGMLIGMLVIALLLLFANGQAEKERLT